MSTAVDRVMPFSPTASPSRRAVIAYWASTLFVTLTALWSGIADIAHLEPLYGVLLHLGYPPYFGVLLGAFKILGAIVLLAPGRPLAKEWAYAGVFCDYASATVSHLAVGDGVAAVIGPLLSMGALAASWYLRPAGRRLG
jgi:DoxX-like family